MWVATRSAGETFFKASAPNNVYRRTISERDKHSFGHCFSAHCLVRIHSLEVRFYLA